MCSICASVNPFATSCAYGGASGARVIEGRDATDDRSTAYSIAPGDTFAGSLDGKGDRDWVAVTLTEGESYRATLTGNTLSDPYLRLHDQTGTLVAENDDAGGGLDSGLGYTATATATYYLSAGSYGDRFSGSYAMSIAPQAAAPEGTLSELADFLIDGYWDGDRRAFDTSVDNVIDVDITGLTAEGKQLARWALEAWEMVADVVFKEVGADGDITFIDHRSGAGNWTNASGGLIRSSTINISTDWIATYGQTMDSYSFQTYIHEIGHALGLGHLGPYNSTGSYGVDNIFANDSWQVSVMSYFDQTENTATDASFGYVVSTMMADIAAVQLLYGAPGTGSATAGDTVYGANATVGGYLGAFFEQIFDNGTNSAVYDGGAVALTLYDRSGVDTLNLAPNSSDDRVDLAGGSYSDIGGLIGNLGIAAGTVIENVTGGSGSDTIAGNVADNLLLGNDGDDLLRGGAGEDALRGGRGTDALWAGEGDDLLFGDAGDDTLGGGAGNDTLWAGGRDDLLYGGTGNDELGGGVGDDTVWAGDGDDTVYGSDDADRIGGGIGDDELWAGSGDDEIFGGLGSNRLGGGAGDDTLWGGDDADSVYGADGRDDLNGGAGDDDLWGGDGNDTLRGGGGDDTLGGGECADTFVFAAGFGQDVVLGFTDNLDRLSLSETLWGGTLTPWQVVGTFATIVGGDTVFDFGGGDVLVVAGLANPWVLGDDIAIV